MKQVAMAIGEERSKCPGKRRGMHFGKELLGYIAITKWRRNFGRKVQDLLTAMQIFGTPSNVRTGCYTFASPLSRH